MQRICCDNIPEIMKYEDVFLRLFPIRIQYNISENVIMIDADDPSVVDLAHTLLIHLMSCMSEKESLTDDLIYSVYDAMMSSHKNSAIVKTFTGKPIRPKTENQEKYVHSIRTKLITFCEGPAGSSKTFLAIASACRALRKKEIRKIIITRPVVEAGESLGFLPGDLMEKIDPYLQPLYDSLHDILGRRWYDPGGPFGLYARRNIL